MRKVKLPKYVSRYDNHYRVRIKINNKERLTKCFAFSKHGRIRDTLVAALEWRDMILSEYDLLERLNFIKSPDFSTMLISFFASQSKGLFVTVFTN